MLQLHPIAYARNGYQSKFGIPRQSGRADSVTTRIVFVPAFRQAEALRGIGQFSHLWLLWGFSANSPQRDWSPTVRPPRLGGNKRVGVFATRSPFRPNPIGLSSVRLSGVEQTADEGMVLVVSGADLMDGTPIYDIKPYIAYTDSHPDASDGFAGEHAGDRLAVCVSDDLRPLLPEDIWTAVCEILADDPRPAYHRDEGRIYGMTYEGHEVRFRIEEQTVRVVGVD